MLLLTREDIKKITDMHDNIDAAAEAYKMNSLGEAESPLRIQMESKNEDGTMLAMPAYAKGIGAASVKVVSVFPNNIKKGLPGSPAQVVLIDAETGIVTSLIDGTYVTQLRTGAASGVAFRALAKKDARKGALIGTGGQGACQLEAMLAACPNLEEVYVYDAFPGRAAPFAEMMQAELSQYSAKIIPAETSDQAVEDADVLITVTPAKDPVFDATKLKPGITVSCVGSFQPDMSEMDPRLLNMASKVFCDSVEAVLSESGDLLKPIAAGTFKEEDITGDIGDLLLGKLPGRENDEEIIVFETVGIGIQDLVAAKLIYDKARKAGVGTVWGE